MTISFELNFGAVAFIASLTTNDMLINAGQVRYKLDYKSMFMKHPEFPYFLHKRNDSLLM